MTRFERDIEAVKKDASMADIILRERQAELDDLWKKGCREKNGFRRDIIAHDYRRLQKEYNAIDSMI